MKGFAHVVFACLYALVTFFGIGPVLLADGTTGERLITSVIVFAIFGILILIHLFLVRKLR